MTPEKRNGKRETGKVKGEKIIWRRGKRNQNRKNWHREKINWKKGTRNQKREAGKENG